MSLGLKISSIIRKVVKKKIGSIPLHEPNFFGNEWKYLKVTLDENYVSSSGKYVKKFEDKIKEFTKSKYAVSVVNGTEALHLSLKSCGVNLNDEVILPSLTFIGTANAVMYCSAIPHFVDSELDTFGIDAIKLDEYLKKITKMVNGICYNKNTKRRIAAIIPVHIFGNPCKIDQIMKISNKYNLVLIEDAAEALGSFYKKKHLGNFGLVGCISFNGNKIITTGGGGAIITNNKLIADKIRHLSTTAKKSHPWEYIHDEIGYNFRMPNLNASLGLAQMENINQFLLSKRKLFNRYLKEFNKIKNFANLISEQKGSKSNYWLNTIFLKNSTIKKRDLIIKFAHKNKIFLRPSWKPLHTLRPFLDMPRSNIVNANIIYNSCINIPSSSHYYIK
jgi:perosamine synthetase